MRFTSSLAIAALAVAAEARVGQQKRQGGYYGYGAPHGYGTSSSSTTEAASTTTTTSSLAGYGSTTTAAATTTTGASSSTTEAASTTLSTYGQSTLR